MDRSVDSIGSCSLDVDADSSDVSDTSGSLNFATPLSAKDITREFTAKIKERCQLSQNTTTYLDPFSGQIHTIVTPTENPATSPSKKPSYLNLACCVNGYSNLTTYDSKIRQDINKSREVSPIRPSTNSIQHCKKNNSLAPPVFVSSSIKTTQNCKITMTSNQYLNDSIGSNDTVNMADVVDVQYSPQQSFIQQRVERLYGPGALAQVFYSPKKIKSKNSNNLILNERSTNTQSEFCKKYQQLSKSRYFNQCNKPSNDVIVTSITPATDVTDHVAKNTVDLPVLRHLSQEFRAQLPSISPKRSYIKQNTANSNNISPNSGSNTNDTELHNNEVEHENKSSTETSAESLLLNLDKCNSGEIDRRENTEEKDGNQFLEILKQEQNRLLELAHRAEKYLCSLTNNEDISEEVFGLLRSASGKARLLVSQKMKQFEGLCHNHMNRSPEDAFPTTLEDLQGFWDMVYLQVAHIDSIFEEIEELKRNDWKLKPIEEKQPTILSVKSSKVSKPTGPKQKTALNGSNLQKVNNGGVNSSAAALKREAQRKQFLEMKRKNKMALGTDKPQPNTANAIEIFVNENNS
ncbi:uncharacterized protein LOC129920993 [Episyrphus balteatus]|uniref:uncharacterized protein LOC129920993 n=1 Tax=Episyrphus balteatus TaxID=286459 RepID=UPI0024868EC7|nr:uncharacterized protein LOC129920993 [Episyrphus balteatus]